MKKVITTISLDEDYKKQAIRILKVKYRKTLSGYLNQVLIELVNNEKGGKEDGTNST